VIHANISIIDSSLHGWPRDLLIVKILSILVTLPGREKDVYQMTNKFHAGMIMLSLLISVFIGY